MSHWLRLGRWEPQTQNMTGKWKLRKFESQKFRRNTERPAVGCIIGSNSGMSIVALLDNRVSSPVLCVGVWLCGGKECETRGQRLGFDPPPPPPCLSPGGLRSLWFPWKMKVLRGSLVRKGPSMCLHRATSASGPLGGFRGGGAGRGGFWGAQAS